MLKWVEVLLDRICAVVGAIIFSQAPLFMQSYTQQLAGHEKELHLQIELMQQAAVQSGKSLTQYIQKFLSSSDPDFVQQGHLMQDMFSRWETFAQAMAAMQESSVFLRPLAFLTHLNTEVFTSTAAGYTMGLPLNMEGGIYALIGVAVGFFVFYTCRKVVSGLFSLLTKLVNFRRAPA